MNEERVVLFNRGALDPVHSILRRKLTVTAMSNFPANPRGMKLTRRSSTRSRSPGRENCLNIVTGTDSPSAFRRVTKSGSCKSEKTLSHTDLIMLLTVFRKELAP